MPLSFDSCSCSIPITCLWRKQYWCSNAFGSLMRLVLPLKSPSLCRNTCLGVVDTMASRLLVVAVVAVLAVPTLHSFVHTLPVVAQLASTLLLDTCTSHTCRVAVFLSILASGMAAVLAVKRTWAWLRKDTRRIAMLEQTMRQLRADNNGLRFEVRLQYAQTLKGQETCASSTELQCSQARCPSLNVNTMYDTLNILPVQDLNNV
jgi:hypothetical protein